jgi:hypothetical protein
LSRLEQQGDIAAPPKFSRRNFAFLCGKNLGGTARFLTLAAQRGQPQAKELNRGFPKM